MTETQLQEAIIGRRGLARIKRSVFESGVPQYPYDSYIRSEQVGCCFGNETHQELAG